MKDKHMNGADTKAPRTGRVYETDVRVPGHTPLQLARKLTTGGARRRPGTERKREA